MSRLQTNAIRHLGSTVDNLTVDSSGRVSMPNQPAFFARNNEAGGNLTTTGVVPYAVVQTNIGGAYSTSTNRFTAPVAGRYLFIASLTSNSTPTEHSIRKNGVSVVRNQMQALSSGNTGITSLQAIIDLSVGDYVDVAMTAGSRYGWGADLGFATFGGHLIG